MKFVSLAWRNTLRNRRRALLTVSAIGAGICSLALAWSLFDGGNAQMVDNMTVSYSGYVQVHRTGYEDDPSLDYVLRAPPVDEVIAGLPQVVASSGRLEARVLISSDVNARGIILAGVDPTQERGVTNIHQRLVAGSYLQPGALDSLMLGESLAKTLAVGVGDEIAVVTQGMYGSVGAERYRIAGIYTTGNEMVDNMQAFITLDAARLLLGATDELTSIALRLEHRDGAHAVKLNLQGALGDQYEVLEWRELLPAVSQSMDFHEAVAMVVMVFLFGIVALGVANTVLMSVAERTREFGVMLSLGVTPLQLFRSILYEGLFLGLLGLVLGLLVGGGLVGHLAASGIHFRDASGMIETMQSGRGAIYPTLAWPRILLMASGMFAVTFLASFYPAIRTARLMPLEALHGLLGKRTADRGGSATRHDRLPMLLELAMRNLGRQPVRTRLTIAAVTFSLTAFIFLGSIAIGYYAQTVTNATGTLSGDAQVMHPGFKDEMKASLGFSGDELRRRIADLPGVEAVSPRVQNQAMIGVANRSEPVLLIGVAPDLEPKVTYLDQSVVAGRYLAPEDSRTIVIGVKLAELLRIQLGNKVVVTAQDAQGRLTSEALTVVGLFDTGSQGHGVDRLVGYIPLAGAQRLLDLDGRVTNLALRFDDREDDGVLLMVRRVDALLGGSELTVFSWHELLPEVVQMRTLIRQSLLFVLSIVLVMVGVVAANTIFMSVLERTREFGIMLALGSTPGLLSRLVLLESAVLGVLATLLGMLLGSLVALGHMPGGVSMSAHGMTAVPGVTNIVHPELTAAGVLGPAFILPLVILVAASLPALRAGRLTPVDAIRAV